MAENKDFGKFLAGGAVGFLLAWLLTTCPAGAATQATIRGIVTESLGNAPLPDVAVSANGSSAITGPDGRYTIVLAPGTYTVVVTYPYVSPVSAVLTLLPGINIYDVVLTLPQD